MSTKGINPKGKGMPGGEYQSDQLNLTMRVPRPSKSMNTKQAMMDGPYGGKKPQS